MADKPKRLELAWIGKEERPELEPRVLREDTALSYHAAKRVTDHDIFDNLLIYGDNLLALKALEQELAGKIKCVFIDPPYNTGAAFAQYDDGLEHATWLSFMRPRLEALRDVLAIDGSLWIAVDDSESHYLKVLCDEIFGRRCFVANIIWQKKYTVANDARWFSDNHDHVLVYCKSPETWRPNRLPRTAAMDARYANPDGDPRGPWKSAPLHAKSGSRDSTGFAYRFQNGVTWRPPAGTFPRYSAERLRELEENGEISFPRKPGGTPRRKAFLSSMGDVVARTIWLTDEVGHNHEAKTEVKAFNGSDVFATPKPERLLQRILTLATDPGDWVLDSFAGSGTTGAVAHKMGRRWIMMELGEHCVTHIVPRLCSVVDGNDSTRVTKATGWRGGGGFRFHRLALPR